MITAIILAAGASKRMGQPKALLRIGGQSFIRRIIGVLNHSAIEHIIAVLGADAALVQEDIEGLTVKSVVNEHYRHGQLSSLIMGINEAERFQPGGIIVHPVDHPLVTAETVDALVERFLLRSPGIVVPTFRGRRGHPVIFSSSLFRELKQAPVSIGARAVVWAHKDAVVEVPCADAGVVTNINTQDEYANLQRPLQSPA
jgi:molybdenum cofactor cytidylyltransferase